MSSFVSEPTPVVTVGELLRDAAGRLAASGSDTPRLDAEVLLGHVLGVDRATLLAAPEAQVGPGQRQSFETFVDRRLTGEPVSYIRGLKEFYGLALSVDRRALIPRPETELLVDLALARIRERLTSAPRPQGAAPLRVLDIGTGSGAICIALAVESRRRGWAGELSIGASDVSTEAVSLALENAVAHGVADAIEFAAADLGGGQPAADFLTANLPYIPSEVVPTLAVAASFEPVAALDGGPDGLDVIRRLVARLPSLLRQRGTALLEIGAEQAPAVKQHLAERLPGWHVVIHDDLAGRPRVVEIGRPG